MKTLITDDGTIRDKPDDIFKERQTFLHENILIK